MVMEYPLWMEVFIGKWPISMVHGFQPAMELMTQEGISSSGSAGQDKLHQEFYNVAD